MRKLINGIVEFRQNNLETYRKKFAKLALGQNPDTLFIACSDSRVVPNAFASTDPGDLFVIRNVGNLIPCCGEDGHSSADESEAAAIEFAVMNLEVSNIIVCGHSDCGAMHTLIRGREKVKAPNLRAWLRHGETSLNRLPKDVEMATAANRLSKQNVLQQLENLKTYPLIEDRIRRGKLSLHAWWFELISANVYSYDAESSDFILIDEKGAKLILERLS